MSSKAGNKWIQQYSHIQDVIKYKNEEDTIQLKVWIFIYRKTNMLKTLSHYKKSFILTIINN